MSMGARCWKIPRKRNQIRKREKKPQLTRKGDSSNKKGKKGTQTKARYTEGGMVS